MSVQKFVCCPSLVLAATAFAMGPRTAAAAVDFGTLTRGQVSIGCGGYYGYNSTYDAGAYSPNGLAGGNTVSRIYEYFSLFGAPGCVPGLWSALTVTGFSADPGASWLNSITCNGTTRTPAGATYVYSDGVAGWIMTGSFGLLTLPNGNTVGCSIDHD